MKDNRELNIIDNLFQNNKGKLESIHYYNIFPSAHKWFAVE